VALDPTKAHERRWWTLGVLCLSLTVISIDNTILNVALPSIVRGLGARGAQLQWIIDAYTIVFACLLLTAGALGDKFGRKRALTIGLVLFGTFSALASQAHTADQLILARALMGVGGAFIFPTTLSILTNTFDGQERARAIGIWAGVSGLGIAVGPLIGGVLVEHFAWGSVFLVNVPVVISAIVLGRFFIPETKASGNHPLDPLGAVLSVLALVFLLYAIIEIPDAGWGATHVMGAFALGTMFLGGFIWWERTTDHPMLDVRFFKNPRFSAASATVTLTYFALFGSTFLLTQYFQFVLGYSPVKAGMLTAPIAIGLMMAAPNAPKLAHRYGTKIVVVCGLGVVALGLVMYGVEPIISSFVGGLLVRTMFGIGMGLTMAPATESIMGSLPLEKAGVGSAVNDTTRQVGGALGVAVIGSIFAWRYHAAMAAVDVPAGADAARESIGRAVQVVSGLPADQALALKQATADAYISGMNIACYLAAAVVAAAMVVAWKWLPARAELAPHEFEPIGDHPTEGQLVDLDAELDHIIPIPD